MSNVRLKITVDGVCVFGSGLDVDPAEACFYAQQQVDVHSWANPGAHVVGELTAPHGERHLIRPTGVAS